MDNLPVALIPAYKPSPVVCRIAEEIKKSGVFQGILCVDDGSGGEFGPIFDELEGMGVKILRHAVNLGKGMALRTGLNACLAEYPSAVGVVTLDADGQHLAGDVAALGRALLSQPACLILGGRIFDDRDIPFRSRFGNVLTKHVFNIMSGIRINDTQTGLRGIPSKFIPHLLKLKTTGYDFELDMLICAKEERIKIVEIPITTVYADGNSSSHFNPLFDSLRIYFVFLRYAWVGFLSFAIDFAVFLIFLNVLKFPVIGANVAARGVSSTFNFILNRKVVFKSKGNIYKEYAKYFILMLYIMMVNTSVVYFTYNYVTKFSALVKVTAEIITFFFTFFISRTFVFKDKIK